MSNDDLESPIVATGRGGSGTRLLSTVLQKLGCHLGNELNESGDSMEWAEVIYDIVLSKLNAESYRVSNV